MFRDWMIRIRGHSSGALQTRLRYTGRVRIKSAICIYTGADTMVGNQRK